MTTKEKQGFGLYFLLAFGMAWLLQVYASLLLLRDGNAAAYQLLLAVSMFCPLVSVLLVQKFWLHQPTGISWRPRLKGNGRYLLAAWFGPAVFTVLAAVLYFAVFPSRLDTSGSWLATAYGGQWTPEALKTELGVTTTSYLIQNGLLAVTLAPLANMIPAVGEEAGWRGYMMPRLKERLGLLNGRLLGGGGRLLIGAAVGIPLLAQGLGRLMGLVLDGALLLNRSHAFGIVAVRSKGHRDHGHGQRHTQ